MLLDPGRSTWAEVWLARLLPVLLVFFLFPTDRTFPEALNSPALPFPNQGGNYSGLVAVTFYGTCPKGVFAIYNATVSAEKEKLAKLACNTHFYSLAEPGTHTFCVNNKNCITTQLYPNTPYYFRVPAHTIGYGLEMVAATIGSVEVSSLKPLESKRHFATSLVSIDLNRPPASFLRASAPLPGMPVAAPQPAQSPVAPVPANTPSSNAAPLLYQQPMVQQAIAEENRNNFDGALAIYRQVAAQNPNDASIHAMIGVVLVKIGRFDDAIASLVRANSFSEQSSFHYWLGNAYRLKNSHAEALRSYQRAIALNPDPKTSWQSYVGLAGTCCLLGYYDQAARALDLLPQNGLDPEAQDAVRGIRVQLYLAQEMYPEASGLDRQDRNICAEVSLGNPIVIRNVYKGGPADLAGMKPGDVLVALGGAPVSNIEGLRAALNSAAYGSTIPIRINRNGTPLEFNVIAGVPPNLPSLAAAARNSPSIPVASPPSPGEAPVRILRLNANPAVTQPGGSFKLEVEYIASDGTTGTNTVPVQFAYSIAGSGQVLYQAPPATINVPNNQPVLRTQPLTAAQRSGLYTITVNLRCVGSVVEQSIDFRIE
jgi:hypothetical protein